jgi:hypothetical protein
MLGSASVEGHYPRFDPDIAEKRTACFVGLKVEGDCSPSGERQSSIDCAVLFGLAA